MTEQEQQIWDMVHKFCEDLYINIPDMNRRYLMDKIKEYASQQRTEGIKEGFEAARSNGKVFNGKLIRIALTYPTVKDYLNSK